MGVGVLNKHNRLYTIGLRIRKRATSLLDGLMKLYLVVLMPLLIEC